MAFNAADIPHGYLDDWIEEEGENLDGYIAFQTLRTPREPITSASGTFPIWDRKNKMGSGRPETKVGRGAGTPERDSKVRNVQYECEEYRVKDSIDKLTRMELDEALDAAGKMTEGCEHTVRNDLDLDLAIILKGGGSAANNDLIDTVSLAVGEEFNNYDSSSHDPYSVIEQMKRDTRGDRLYIGENVLDALRVSPSYTTPEKPNYGPEEFVQLLRSKHGFREIIVGDLRYHQGSVHFDLNQTGSFDDVCAVGKSGSLYRVPLEEVYRDAYADPDSRKEYVRAGHTTDIIVSSQSDWVGIDANILE
jgi:hypothetical protein